MDARVQTVTAAPKVSVIVPHYNDLRQLDLCLAALAAQTFTRQEVEIIVADNASPQGLEAVQAVVAGRAKLVSVSEKGAGPARNGGVAVATGEILAFTDSDCRPDRDWLEEGVRALGADDFVGGRMRVSVRDPAQPTAAEAFELVFAFHNETYVTQKGFSVTANLLCPRRVFETVGGFRVGVPEDLDWSHRARDAGFRIGYAPKAVVWHPARRSWPELQGKWRRLNRESFGLLGSRKGGRLLWVARCLALPLVTLADSARVLGATTLATSRQKWAALGMLYRLRTWRFIDSMRLLIRSGEA